ncbi:glycosyltransferase family 2 protein [Arcobacter sp. CECT 8985]|uniref:glycosyltransferase family 2 protein n=1 Tax=Arcobacter sp. CECT 8985 TaxID=1935424 RepID=UPI00100AAD8B|nr:glycosyltransferase family 2 protein [Arcobacter sp. CECT 8985]RXJ84869.1 glycosyl transferase [Arcobacter sp. CECT 8985]
MKVSIVTVVFNAEKTIRDTIESVLNQTYNNIEYIIIDGKSTDNTMKIVNEYKNKIDKIVCENDDGLYSAINKGITIATGDVIGFIHSDDFYLNTSVIQKVVDEFENKNVDSIFADLLFIKNNNTKRALRYYSAKKFTPKKLKYGFMPPHPTFFVKKEIYKKYGKYKTDYKIAADYEMFVRLLYINKITYSYINLPLIKMRVGGISSGGIKTKITCNIEVIRAIKSNGIKTNHFVILKKYPIKIMEIIKGYIYNILVKIKK